MLQFICPYCNQSLRVPVHYLGQRGKCKKCGARIALLGDAQKEGPQQATRVEDAGLVAQEEDAPLRVKPMSQAQRDYLMVLGASEVDLRDLTLDEASALIETLKRERHSQDLPTEEQLAYLRRLGLSTKELIAVGSKEEASFLIERLQPKPTEHQIQYLQRLGARPEDIAALRTKSEAAALIERFLSGGFGNREEN